ncbi:hypothetical protein AVEN_211201-1, partial [Araneus ventricosus]
SQSHGHSPTPPERCTYYHWWRDLQPNHYYIPRGSEFLLTYPAATRPCTRGAAPGYLIRPKEHHPALPKHPGKQLKDRPPQQIVRHCGSCKTTPITSGSCNNPRFTGARTVIGSGHKEPHHHYCAIGLTRACLLIRQPLLRELTVSPR